MEMKPVSRWQKKAALILSAIALSILATVALKTPPKSNEPPTTITVENQSEHLLQLEKQISSKEAEIQILKDRISEIHQSTSQVATEKQNLEIAMAELQKEALEYRQIHAENDNLVQLSNTQLKSLELLVENKEEEKISLLNTIEEIHRELNQLKELKNQHDEISQLNLIHLNEKLVELTDELEKNKKEMQILTAEKDLQIKNQQSLSQEQQLRVDAEAKVIEMTTALIDQKKLIERLEDSKEELSQQLDNQKQDYQNLLSKNEMFSKEIEKLRSQQALLISSASQQGELKKALESEKIARINAEELLHRVTVSLQEQKSYLQKIETARKELVLELASTKEAYANVLKDLKAVSKKEPVATVSSEGKKVHVVAQGDTLSSISSKYYGTSQRWNDLYEANVDRLPNKDSLKPGIILLIP